MMAGLISDEMKARIKACPHPEPRAAGMGYAICDDCGALLPDEDPDLRAKCEPTP